MTLDELRLIRDVIDSSGWGTGHLAKKKAPEALKIIDREINLKTTDYVKNERRD